MYLPNESTARIIEDSKVCTTIYHYDKFSADENVTHTYPRSPGVPRVFWKWSKIILLYLSLTVGLMLSKLVCVMTEHRRLIAENQDAQ
jgi:hypothetical protein